VKFLEMANNKNIFEAVPDFSEPKYQRSRAFFRGRLRKGADAEGGGRNGTDHK